MHRGMKKKMQEISTRNWDVRNVSRSTYKLPHYDNWQHFAPTARFYFGNEGGARHIAQALEIPSFAIYSPSASKSMWLPANSVLARGISPDDILPPEQQVTLTYEERFALITPEKVYDQLTSTLRQLS